MSIKLVMGAVLILCVVGMVTALCAGGHAERCHLNKDRHKNSPDAKSLQHSADHKKHNQASF